MQTYGIGGNEVPIDASEAFADIPKNRTLIVQKLTDKAAVKPEIVEGLKTVEEVFEHYQPKVTVDLQNLDGSVKKEELRFKNLGDFGAKGITAQSDYLQGLQTKKDEYQKIIKFLRSNKVLRSVVSDPEKKKAVLQAVQIMIKELKKTELK